MQPCTALFEPARLLIVEVTILPVQILIKKSHINLIFSAYLLEIHLPCTIIWDTFTLHLYLICNPTLLFKPARLLILEDFSSLPFYFSLRLY